MRTKRGEKSIMSRADVDLDIKGSATVLLGVGQTRTLFRCIPPSTRYLGRSKYIALYHRV